MKILGFVLAMLMLATVANAASIPVFPQPNGQFKFGCRDAKAARGEAFDKNKDSFQMDFFRIVPQNGSLGVVEVDDTGTAFLTVTVDGTSDVEVVCFAIDKSGNRSARSVDSFLVDRTAPEAPVLVP